MELRKQNRPDEIVHLDDFAKKEYPGFKPGELFCCQDDVGLIPCHKVKDSDLGFEHEFDFCFLNEDQHQILMFLSGEQNLASYIKQIARCNKEKQPVHLDEIFFQFFISLIIIAPIFLLTIPGVLPLDLFYIVFMVSVLAFSLKLTTKNFIKNIKIYRHFKKKPTTVFLYENDLKAMRESYVGGLFLTSDLKTVFISNFSIVNGLVEIDSESKQ